ncbi:FAD-dependent oxidoreductase [Mycobacterium dioxanotrophicus]|uniref:FAD-dependent oxidoreductase n=1 Tax=Mycobacterium dioxanotrophicus TaxID=482462 RepID=A0A1Y0CEJ0_9MYCO|nr:NAD(P)/FAD-dependent oxidoreductase [Mycobacterium dioxanotrophicus]ART73681.1 FAD-dependent oxidoreductase [Mycobacterium dioxanotrophicus]
MTAAQVAVVGAGPAGVAMAVSLRDRGLHPLLIDKGEVAASWRRRYDRLKLNTGRRFSHLPNRPYPRGTPTFPHRDQVVHYLDRHAREAGIKLWLGTEITRIDRHDNRWLLRAATSDIAAQQVVVATGEQHAPQLPDWPAVDQFTGELLHSSEYRNPESYRGSKVLVVGAGASGLEIAHDLSAGGADHVWLAVRTPPNIMLRSMPGGLPADWVALPLYHAPTCIADAVARAARRTSIGDLSQFGLPIPDEGVFTRDRRLGQSPTLVDMDVIDAIKNGSIEVVSAVESFDADKVLLADGTKLSADVVIAATGYRRDLTSLLGHLGVLDDNGRPLVMGKTAAAPGLRFFGYLSRPALIGHFGKQAQRVAKRIAMELSAGR